MERKKATLDERYAVCPPFENSRFWGCQEQVEILRARQALYRRINPRGSRRTSALLDLLVKNCGEEAELAARHYFLQGAVALLQTGEGFDA